MRLNRFMVMKALQIVFEPFLANILWIRLLYEDMHGWLFLLKQRVGKWEKTLLSRIANGA